MRFLIFVIFFACFFLGYRDKEIEYVQFYKFGIKDFKNANEEMISDLSKFGDKLSVDDSILIEKIHHLRIKLKKIDFWLRYMDPIEYKKINGPLNIEWEIEAFEKFEKPYLRQGGGLFLAETYLEDKNRNIDSLKSLFQMSQRAINSFLTDSILQEISKPEVFYLSNRLFLLNLASIYTTGFECPNKESIIPELKLMIIEVGEIYKKFLISFSGCAISEKYLLLFNKMSEFVQQGDADPDFFNHFKFISNFVNPLFALNQEMIRKCNCSSISYNEFTLSNEVNSIFDKSLFEGQDMLGVYRKVKDTAKLYDVYLLGKQLFNDPLFSSNNQRACASCHKPQQYLTDTTQPTAMQFNRIIHMDRNTPSLINVKYNHLLLLDGRHYSMSRQMKEVIENPIELNSNQAEILKKILSCKDYTSKLKELALLCGSPKIEFTHLSSAISYYLNSYGNSSSEFDSYINHRDSSNSKVVRGFNLFMSKAQCGTCHYVPTFSGVKAPFISSEFEIIGVPTDTMYSKLSVDIGRYKIVPSKEMMNAFRTSTLRNIQKTKPYMHNGVFNTLEQVMDFYNEGGGSGKGLNVPNQTLSPHKLNLTKEEIQDIIEFLNSLTEEVRLDYTNPKLPNSNKKFYNQRISGGEY